MVIRRFEIYWVSLDPTIGREMRKTHPAAVISPNEVNNALGTVLVAPITSGKRNFPTRIPFELNGKENYMALDQIRAVDKSRFTKKITVLNEETAQILCNRLQELFVY
jgi:mRNA interferase MazF